VRLAPAHVEAIRGWLLERNKPYAATLVSVIAYRFRLVSRALAPSLHTLALDETQERRHAALTSVVA
jgi:hypothetical protein